MDWQGRRQLQWRLDIGSHTLDVGQNIQKRLFIFLNLNSMGKKHRQRAKYFGKKAVLSVGPTLDTMQEVGEISNVQIVFGLPTGLPTWLPPVICPYCGKEAIWWDNKRIYGKNFGKSYKCYLCKDCDAYVGCHNNTKVPLGTLANKDLRNLRRQAHALFDPLWKTGKMTRKEAYKLLDDHFGREIHIGESDNAQCMAIIHFLKSR